MADVVCDRCGSEFPLPGARFLPLESDNHLILAHEPAWPIWRSAVRGFLAAETASGTSDRSAEP
jgi:hypothetical protein